MGYIYKITNTVSGKMYVGETKEEDVERRWKQHKNTIKHGRGCPALQDAVRKYGWNVFKFEIVVICFDENRYAMEQYYIKKYNTLTPNGYNITLGGVGGGFVGKKHTPETLAKIKESLAKFKEENPNHFETYKEKLSQSLKKLNISERMQNSEKWQAAVKEGRVGGSVHKQKGNNEAIRQKISESLKKYFKENTTLTQGITIGLKHLLEANVAILIATGQRKAEVLKQTFVQEPSVKLPSTVFKLHSNAFVWIDEAAAQLL